MPVGRPRKAFIAGDEPVLSTLKLPRHAWELLPKDRTKTEVIYELIMDAFGDSGTKELRELQRIAKEKEAEYRAATVKVKHALHEIRRKEEIRKTQAFKEKYLVAAFSEFIKKMQKHGFTEIKISDQVISKQYGIWIDKNILNMNYSTVMDEIETEPDHEIVMKYGLKKTQRGQFEPAIMASISPTV